MREREYNNETSLIKRGKRFQGIGKKEKKEKNGKSGGKSESDAEKEKERKKERGLCQISNGLVVAVGYEPEARNRFVVQLVEARSNSLPFKRLSCSPRFLSSSSSSTDFYFRFILSPPLSY